MDLPMDQDKLKNLIANFMPEKLQGDEIEPFIQQLRKNLIEQALQGEMDAPLAMTVMSVIPLLIAVMVAVKRL